MNGKGDCLKIGTLLVWLGSATFSVPMPKNAFAGDCQTDQGDPVCMTGPAMRLKSVTPTATFPRADLELQLGLQLG